MYVPGQRWPEYARELLELWNKRGGGHWKYALTTIEGDHPNVGD